MPGADLALRHLLIDKGLVSQQEIHNYEELVGEREIEVYEARAWAVMDGQIKAGVNVDHWSKDAEYKRLQEKYGE